MDLNLLFTLASYLTMGLRWLGVPFWLCDLLLLNVGALTVTLGVNQHQQEGEGAEERDEGGGGLITEGKREGNRLKGEMGERERKRKRHGEIVVMEREGSRLEGEIRDREREGNRLEEVRDKEMDVRKWEMKAGREEKGKKMKGGEREEKANEGTQREEERDVGKEGKNTTKEENGARLEENEIEENNTVEKVKDDEPVFERWEMDARRREKGRQQGEMGTHSSSSSNSSLQSLASSTLPSLLPRASSSHSYCPHTHPLPRCGPTPFPYSPFRSFPPKSHPFLHLPCSSRDHSTHSQSHSTSSSSSLNGEMGERREAVSLDLSEWSDGVVHLSVWPREAQISGDRCGSQADDEVTWVKEDYSSDSSLSSARETCGWDKLEPCPLYHSHNLPPPLQNFENHQTGLEDLETINQNLQNSPSGFETVENHPPDFETLENDGQIRQNSFIALQNLQDHLSVSEDLRKREKNFYNSSISYANFINENEKQNNLFTTPRDLANVQTSSTPSGNYKNQEEKANNYPEPGNHPRIRAEDGNNRNLKNTSRSKIEVEDNTNLTTPNNKEGEWVEEALTPSLQTPLTPLRAQPLPRTAHQPPSLAPPTPSEPRVAKVRAEEALRERLKAREFARRGGRK